MTGLVFLTLFLALTGVYALFLNRVQQGLAWLPERERELRMRFDDAGTDLPAVAVIVPVCDEEESIAACIRSLAAQDYPADRIRFVIVDDGSRDATAVRARAAIAGDLRFECIAATDGIPLGKKHAITRGVAAVESDIILTTDADCTHDPCWVRAMMTPFADGADVVSGPVIFADRSTLFTRLQTLEFLGLVGVGAGLIGVGYPRLSNGANFAYRRARFIEAGGYDGDALASGDDELLMHAIVYRHGGHPDFVSLPEAVVRTAPARSVSAFLRQRTRWAGKGLHYADRSFVLFLLVLFVYFAAIPAVPLIALASPAAASVACILILVKWLLEARVLIATAAMLRVPLRIGDLLVAEILHAPYIVIASLAGAMGIGSWKKRPLRHSTR